MNPKAAKQTLTRIQIKDLTSIKDLTDGEAEAINGGRIIQGGKPTPVYISFGGKPMPLTWVDYAHNITGG